MTYKIPPAAIIPSDRRRVSQNETSNAMSNESGSGISLSKTWRLPARPKPGRKPAPDTPDNKRKQQNRQAQRSFRERRAAKLQDLEGEMRHTSEQHAKEMHFAEKEKERLSSDNIRLRQMVQALTLELERARSVAASMQSDSPKPRPLRSFDGQRLSIASVVNPEQPADATSIPSSMSTGIPMTPPMEIISEQPAVPQDSWNLDRDLLGKSVPLLRKKRKFEQSCGFCSAGMPCVCDEESEALKVVRDTSLGCGKADCCRGRSRITPDDSSTALSATEQVVAGGPEGEGAVCTGDPGSCGQCQRDPMSTLFCQSLAAKGVDLIAGGRRPRSFATFEHSSVREDHLADDSSADTVYIPCSAAYQSLSRHPRFGEAELATIVGLMRVREGRGVDVESVRSALQELDRI
ncbi:hypothetical protein PYCC9005_004820 [Savitreella phatthalungensis]